MSQYNLVIETNNATVVTEYEPLKKKSDAYQSEQALENECLTYLGIDNIAQISKDAAIAKAKADKEVAVAQAKEAEIANAAVEIIMCNGKESVIVISDCSSSEDFMNTLVHEARHLQ